MLINASQYDLELLTQLRNKIYLISLFLLISVPTLLVSLLDFTGHDDSTEILFIWFFIIVLGGLSYQLRRVSLWFATYSMFIGLLVLFTYQLHAHPTEPLLAMIPIFVPPAMLLLGRRHTLILTGTVILIVLSAPVQFRDAINLLPHLIIICLAFLTSTIIIQEFYVLLTTMQDYQNYALEQMKDARERRGILASRTKQLATSTENLSYANRQLRIAKLKIEEAHKLKAQFAANVSHELRTPINLVVGFAETIMRFPNVYGGRTLPAEYISDIRTIYRNAKHLQNLINDVLDISQIESGHMALVKEGMTIDVVILEAINMLKDQIHNKGLDLQIDIPDNLPTMWLDRVRMRQVFINLLANAIRFTDTGHISIRTIEDDSCLIIHIADTGIGIELGEEEHIFEEFYQTNNINRRGEGSGLGLTLCRRFVQMHGGEIHAERLDIGSAFWIRMPIEMQSALATTGELRALSLEKNNILVYSKDPKIIEFFERHLNKQNIISIQQIEAIETYIDTNPTALIIDKDDYQKLADQPQLKTAITRMSIITCPMPSGRQYMQTLGVADYLIKPVSADMLKLSVQQLPIQPNHILIVDDEREIVRLFARLLKAIVPDCHLTMAYSGHEALALLESLRPDLVLLDIIMPDVDGLTVLDIMKANPELTHIPVIIASAKGASEAISPSKDGDLVVHKSDGFQPLELLQCIESIVDTLNPPT